MEPTTRRQLLHDIRGRLNGLQLCVAALDTSTTPSERIEFLDDIVIVSEKLDRLMAQLDEMMEKYPQEYNVHHDSHVHSAR